jgi:prepilin-type N-terminal cleavage/methylation domain-containing protein
MVTRRIVREAHGYTLVELMAVVTILGILAAISIPMYKGYVNRSKASEATGSLLEIKNRQESYYADTQTYLDVSVTADNWFPSGDPSDDLQIWPDDPNWQLLGWQPPGRQVYFSYAVVAGPVGSTPAGVFGGDALGYDGTESWFVARALGDLDGDNTNVTFESYSARSDIWCSAGAGWE